MRKLLIIPASLAGLAFAPALSLADTVVIDPGVDTWIMGQPDADSIVIQGDVLIGEALPSDVKTVEVPKYDKYGFIVVGKKRVLVDRSTRKVIKVY